MSLPAKPVSLFAAELPINVLLSALPVPLIAVLPVRVKFSTLGPIDFQKLNFQSRTEIATK
jgi:hypothetical protein